MTASPRRARIRQTLVVAQVALSLMLLVSAGLFLRTLQNAQALDPGFSTRNGLFASIDLLPAGYDAPRGRAFFRDLLARVREMPGVEAASSPTVPLGFGGGSDTARASTVTHRRRTRRCRLLQPRRLRLPEDDGHCPRRGPRIHRSATPPIGRTSASSTKRWSGGTSRRDPDRRSNPARRAHAPSRRRRARRQVQQHHRVAAIVHVHAGAAMVSGRHSAARQDVRRSGPAGSAIHEVLRALDAERAAVRREDDRRAFEIAVFIQRMVASLLGAFGALALLLATVGLYGVIAASGRAAHAGNRDAHGARRDAAATSSR